jgi:hypothetical protein
MAQITPEDHALVRSGRRCVYTCACTYKVDEVCVYMYEYVYTLRTCVCVIRPNPTIHKSQTHKKRTSSSFKYAWSRPPLFFVDAAPAPPRALCRASGSAAAAARGCGRRLVPAAVGGQVDVWMVGPIHIIRAGI